MKITPLILSSLMAGAMAVPMDNDVLHTKRGMLSGRWAKHQTLNPDTKIPVRIALKQQNLHKGMDYLMEVSDPSSSKYGKHYTADEVTELFAPDEKSITAVKNWLIKSGVPEGTISSSKSRGWMDFETTVGQLQDVLKTTYHIYNHVDGKGQHIGAEEYKVPSELSDHIDFITPAMAWSKKTPASKVSHQKSATETVLPHPETIIPVSPQMVKTLADNPEDTQYCSDYVTPSCIREVYNITKGKRSSPNNRLGIFESGDEMYKQSDLTTFYGLFSPNIPRTTGPKVDLIDFGNTPPNPNNAVGEAALDFDMAIPIVYPQQTELYQTFSNFNPANGTTGFFNQFLDAVDGAYCNTNSHGEKGDDPKVDGETPNEQCGTFKPANVISFSYGWAESDYPDYYLQRQCDEFMKLGLQGTTLVFSSGDGGVAGGHGGDCLGKKGEIFNPQVGAACPYVTVVGSTLLPPGSAPGAAEIATSRFSSGGGFSNTWPTPNYQQAAVSSYFSNYDPGFPSYTTSGGKIPTSGGVYNRAGRAYPDIAALGDYGVIVFNGAVGRIGGTSMSAPIIAAIFNRINEERIAKKKGPIGFANPALYANPKMFNDVTIGNMVGGDGQCNGKGFEAVPGWDPVSGLGTPNYPVWLDYFMKL